jgi:recombinational DNA repair protein RecT
MARKTVIKRLAKRLPSSADLDQVIASDNEVAGFATPDAPAAPVAAPAALPAAEAVATQVRTTSRLKRSIAKAVAVEEPVVQETTQAEEPATPAQEEVTDDAAAIPHF